MKSDRKFERTQLIFNNEGMERLKNAHVLVVGLGGVGGFACEALVRSGVGNIDILDFDKVDESNINRQIIACENTVGRKKAQVMYERIKSINSRCNVEVFDMFYSCETADSIPWGRYDYIIDAIDIVTSKIHLIKTAHEKNVPIISALGTGNKSDPQRFQISDISKTSVCPLARVMRRELKRVGVDHTKVLFSTEQPISVPQPEDGSKLVASNSFTPSIAGLLLAREVILEIVGAI